MSLGGHPMTEVISRMLDGMLDPKVQALSELHLSHCEPCRSRLEGLRLVRGVLQKLPAVETHPLRQLEPPLFVPVLPPPLTPWVFTAGLMIGMMGIGFLFLRPVNVPMRVVSSPSGSAELNLQRSGLEEGMPLRSFFHGDVDLEIPNQVLLRLKPGATVTWQQLNRPWIFGGKPRIVLNVMQGRVLARTKEGFWGSNLEVRTPTASAKVTGTAFDISVQPQHGATTTLKVLAGSVFFSPYLNQVGVDVRAGEVSQIEGRRLPNAPAPLSSQERRELMETFRIGRDPAAALVLGAGPERVQELFQPALLYLTDREHSELQPYLKKLVEALNDRILEGTLTGKEPSLKLLDDALEGLRAPEISVPLRMFVGACYSTGKNPMKAEEHFRWVREHFPQHSMASLSLAASAYFSERTARDLDQAHDLYQKVLLDYPDSPEAVVAKAALERLL